MEVLSELNPHQKKPSRAALVEAVVAHYVEKKPRCRPGAKERTLIEARLKEGFTVVELFEAIDGCLARPTVSESGKVFDGLELIVRNSAKVNQFRNVEAKNGTAATAQAIADRVKAKIEAEQAGGVGHARD